MNLRAVILCFALLLSAPLFARESTEFIVMKNGDRITYEVKGLNGGVLYVSPPYVIQTISDYFALRSGTDFPRVRLGV